MTHTNELLEALKACKQVLGKMQPDKDGVRAYSMAQEAIAKAEAERVEPVKDTHNLRTLMDVTIDSDEALALLREYAAGLVAKAVAAEREQCAKLCEQFTHYGEASAMICVTAIRSRGNV